MFRQPTKRVGVVKGTGFLETPQKRYCHFNLFQLGEGEQKNNTVSIGGA